MAAARIILPRLLTVPEDKLSVDKEVKFMSRNSKHLIPQASAALDTMKYEVATGFNINLKNGYNGDLTSAQNGRVGGEMVKRMIQQYEQSISQGR
jgi:small acid-soluble spore protein D (minor alpha/beta-type SASP)